MSFSIGSLKIPRNVQRSLLVLLAALVAWWVGRGGGGSGTQSVPADFAEAVAERKVDVVVEVTARVTRLLDDDTHPPRHQRFLVKVADRYSILVAHNTDLAPRVPVAADDEVELRGEYAWNPKGGVIHWTHHDPRGRREGGWIKHRGRTYR